MKKSYKIIAWIGGGVAALALGIVGYAIIKDKLNPEFKETKIYPDDNRKAPADTVFNINGVPFRMIGVRGGKIDCRGLEKTIELSDFYIGETEVTQELWTAVMGDSLSVRTVGDSLPIESIDLVECVEFVKRLDSISDHHFNIPSYPQWLYVAHLANQKPLTLDSIAWHQGNSGNEVHIVKQKHPDSLGIYDMYGNVAEWTISGSDPLFIVAGGSFENQMEEVNPDSREFDHAKVKIGTIGLRLVSYPSPSLSSK